MINRFNKPASTKVRDFTQETDAQLAYRLQNEEFHNLHQEKKTSRNPLHTQTQNLQINDDLTEIAVDGIRCTRVLCSLLMLFCSCLLFCSSKFGEEQLRSKSVTFYRYRG